MAHILESGVSAMRSRHERERNQRKPMAQTTRELDRGRGCSEPMGSSRCALSFIIPPREKMGDVALELKLRRETGDVALELKLLDSSL
jgi:hypothetical protein